MKLLRIEIKASTGHFAIPFLIFERKTFPIPMYSTMIGFVCNILADEAKISRFLSSNFSMAVVGDHDGVVEEYTWFRNLSKESHTKKFICSFNREANNEIEHPGGSHRLRFKLL